MNQSTQHRILITNATVQASHVSTAPAGKAHFNNNIL